MRWETSKGLNQEKTLKPLQDALKDLGVTSNGLVFANEQGEVFLAGPLAGSEEAAKDLHEMLLTVFTPPVSGPSEHIHI